jgi:hypothetical protein
MPPARLFRQFIWGRFAHYAAPGNLMYRMKFGAKPLVK